MNSPNQDWLDQKGYDLTYEQFQKFQKTVDQRYHRAHQDGVDLSMNAVREWVVKEFI
jgi:hypothetical protein